MIKIKSTTIKIQETSYPLYIGENLLQNKSLLKQHIKASQIMIVSNKTIAPLYLHALKNAYHNYQCDVCLLPDGEQYKNFKYWQFILDALVTHHHHRDTTLLALGGGVVSDITGFAAACYQRGVNFISLPTTLLAQVDASIGGKTAINHPTGKNLIGAFHAPSAVIIDINTLHTLPEREFKAGIAEIIKVALIQDSLFFNELEDNFQQLIDRNPHYLKTIIKKACEIKMEIVLSDEKEKNGKRMLLNLGHTFAHAIELLLGYGYCLHGEAVAMGLVLAAKLSHRLGLLDHRCVKRIGDLLEKFSLPIKPPKEISITHLIQAMTMDKKIRYNQLPFILLKQIGKAVISKKITENQLIQFFEQLKENS